MKIDILARRGENYYLAKVNDEFFLVDIHSKKFHKSESPDVFYRHGYFEDPEITENLKKQIEAIIHENI